MKNPSKAEKDVLRTAFGTYQLLDVIGEGGNGVVRLVKDEDGNTLAAKILQSSSREKIKRFKNEFVFSSNSNHPNVIKTIDNGITSDGRPFFIMGRFESSLKSIMKNLVPDKCMDVIIKILNGVGYAHKKGVVHRDIKPENILINRNGAELAITDFGIARFSEEAQFTLVETKEGTRLANFEYSAPEQRSRGKNVDHTCDIYACGLIINELFTKVIPHGQGHKTIEQISTKYAFLDPVVNKMIQQDPRNRHQSIDEVLLEISARCKDQESEKSLQEMRATKIQTTATEDKITREGISIKKVDIPEDGTLRIYLNQPVNERWVRAFNNMGSHSAVWGKGPEKFRFTGDMASIPCNLQDAQRVIDHFKGWLPQVLNVYAYNLKEESAEKERREREALRLKIEAEDRRLETLKSLRF